MYQESDFETFGEQPFLGELEDEQSRQRRSAPGRLSPRYAAAVRKARAMRQQRLTGRQIRRWPPPPRPRPKNRFPIRPVGGPQFPVGSDVGSNQEPMPGSSSAASPGACPPCNCPSCADQPNATPPAIDQPALDQAAMAQPPTDQSSADTGAVTSGGGGQPDATPAPAGNELSEFFYPQHESGLASKYETRQSESNQHRARDFEVQLLDELLDLDFAEPLRTGHRISRATPAIEHFIGSEHRLIGDRGSNAASTIIVYDERGTRLTYGEMVALAGDYFTTYEEMRELSKTKAGRSAIAWARWDALDLKNQKVPEPNVPKEIKDSVVERYFLLASQNLSHFSAGGTGWLSYVRSHTNAMADAFEAGQKNDTNAWLRALTKEAFGHHFLTDIFSSGHVRTPRADLRAWYEANIPGSTDRLLTYLAKFMYDRLKSWQQLPPLTLWLESFTKRNIKERVIKLGGEAVNTFSLGDIVSLALHDFDNEGLWVISERDVNGKPVPGGYRWPAVGDAHLGLSATPRKRFTKNPVAAASNLPVNPTAVTRRMAINAVKLSLYELEKVRDLGRKMAGRSVSNSQKVATIKQALGTPPFAARLFVPKVDQTLGKNIPLPPVKNGRSPLEWRWGQLGSIAYEAVDVTVKGAIASGLFKQLPNVPDPVVAVVATKLKVRIRGTRHVYRLFVEHLQKEGIRALELAVGRKAR